MKIEDLSNLSSENSKWSNGLLVWLRLERQIEGTLAFLLFLGIYGELRDGRRSGGFDYCVALCKFRAILNNNRININICKSKS